MTPEERERWERIEQTKEFLAANQAQLFASSQTHDAQIAENSRQIAQLTELTLRIGRVVEEQAHRSEDSDRRVDERLIALAESQKQTDEHMRDLTDRINTLINVVERYFSDGKH